MPTPITESDDFAFGAEAADTNAIDGFEDITWDTDPAVILERRELEFGVNCFDQPIN